MDHDAVPAVGSDVVSGDLLAFASSEQLDLQSDLRNTIQNICCMETEECRPVKEHSETISNDAGVDIRSEQSVVSDFLPQQGSATVAGRKLICDVLKNNDPHLAEHEIDGEKPQNHLSQDVLVSVLSQESGSGCSYGKRVSDSAESCDEPASKRLKASHDFEVSDLVTTEVQTGISNAAVAENLDVSVNVAEVGNTDKSERVAELYDPVEEPLSSVVDINPATSDIQADDINKPQEPLSSKVEINLSTSDIQADDINKPQEPLSSVVDINPYTSDIQADDINKPQEPLCSVVDINPSTSDIQADDINKPQEPLSSKVEINLSTSDIQADDISKPQEPLSSKVEINPSTNNIKSDDFNKPKEPLSSVVETIPPTNNIQADDFDKTQELLSSVNKLNPPTSNIEVDDFSKPRSSGVEINPSTNDIQAGDSNSPQKLISVDSAEGSTECTQQLTTSDAPFSQPKHDCVESTQRTENPNVRDNSSVIQASSVQKEMIASEVSLTQPEQERSESSQRIENPNVPDNSSAIQTASNPSIETLIASQTTDRTIETASTSVALAGDISESRDTHRDPPPLGVSLVESFVSDEKPGTSRSDVVGGETCLSPFEISLVIDNLIRRELEASESSRGSEEEEMSNDDDSGDDESLSDEKMDVDDEGVSSRSDSEGAVRMKDEDESSRSRKHDANEGADQSQVPCELLSQEKDEMAKTAADCRSSGSAEDESKSDLNLARAGLKIDSDREKISGETCDKAEESVKELDVECEKTEGTIKKPDVECEKTEGTIKKPDVECEKTDDIVKKLDIECEKTEDTVKKPDVECEKTESTPKPHVECGKTENGVQVLEIEREQPKLVRSSQEVSSEATPVKVSDLVDPFGSINRDLVSEIGGILMQEDSIKEALPQSTDGGMPKSSELLGGGDTVCSGETVATPECAAEALVANASDVGTEEVAKKLYDPFEDMEVVDEDAATDEDGPTTSADDTNDKTKTASEKGAKKAKDRSGQDSRPKQVQYGPEREDPTQWTKDDQWSRDDQWSGNEQGQWPVDDQASWYDQSNVTQVYMQSRMPGAVPPPPIGPDANYGPSNYDHSNSGSMSAYGMPPPSNMPPPQASWPAPPGYMQPYPGTMPPPMGYGMPMPYGGMTMPPYFGQWGQWPPPGPAYPMVHQQQQQQQQQQGQSYQDWQNWWQSYSTWYSSYMTGWTQPPSNPPQPMDVSHYQSQGSWSTANQQYAPPPPTSKAPLLPSPPPLPSPKPSLRNVVSSATKTDATSSNAKVSYRPTVAKGPILNPSASTLAPSSAPKLRFAISGPVPSATPKSAPPTTPKSAPPAALKSALSAKSSESMPARKDVAAGAKNDQEAGNNIWVGNLPVGTSAVDVRTLISKHGKVLKCKVGSMKTQKDAGLAALVTMETADDVAVCVQMLHESHYNGQRILVRKLKQQ